MNVILCEPAELRADGSVCLTGARAQHLMHVLKVAVGQQVRLGVVDARWAWARFGASTAGRGGSGM